MKDLFKMVCCLMVLTILVMVCIPADALDHAGRPTPVSMPAPTLNLIVRLATPLTKEESPSFTYRNGIRFGMTPDEVKGLERNTPVYTRSEINNGSEAYTLCYANETILGYPCDIIYEFGDNGLELVIANMHRETDDLKQLPGVFAEIDDALIAAYGKPESNDMGFSTVWYSNTERNFGIVHSIQTYDGFGDAHLIGFLYRPDEQNGSYQDILKTRFPLPVTSYMGLWANAPFLRAGLIPRKCTVCLDRGFVEQAPIGVIRDYFPSYDYPPNNLPICYIQICLFCGGAGWMF